MSGAQTVFGPALWLGSAVGNETAEEGTTCHRRERRMECPEGDLRRSSRWRLQSGESSSALACELDVKLSEWASQLERYGDDEFPEPG
jgi:hypothetical protein